MERRKLIQRKAKCLHWLGFPYLDAATDYQKTEEELRKEVLDLERSSVE